MIDERVNLQQTPPIDLFVHIPKTAGTTLRDVLAQNYAPAETFDLGAKVQERIAEFQGYSAAEQRPYRLVVGHMSHGLHAYLKEKRPYRYFTMLRDPVDRVISLYYFIKGNQEHYLHQPLVQDGISIAGYLELEYTYPARNGQTRFLCGLNVQPYYGPVDEASLALAKRNLRDNVAAVGLTERFDESLLLFRHVLGWNRLAYRVRNVTAGRPHRREVTAQDLAAIRAHNALDLDLYEYAQALFAEQMAACWQEMGQFRRARARAGMAFNSFAGSIRARAGG